MINSRKLKKIIDSKGLKLKYVANHIGLSYVGLQLKINNVNGFKTSEIQALCELLEITSPEAKEKIFFAQYVDVKSTKDCSIASNHQD